MDDWMYCILLIGSAMIGALAGIYGQGLRDWSSRPKLSVKLAIIPVDQLGQLQAYIVNYGRKSTRNLNIQASIVVDLFGTPFIGFFADHKGRFEIDPKSHRIIALGVIKNKELTLTTDINENGEMISKISEPLTMPLLVLLCATAQDVITKNYLFRVFEDRIEDISDQMPTSTEENDINVNAKHYMKLIRQE